VVIAVALAGCGGSTRSPTRTVAPPSERPSPTAVRRAKFINTPPDALVSMRRFSPKSLMWQTVFVRTNGTGVLTSLIGEIGGVPQVPFRLPAAQLHKLKRLIARSRPGNYVGSNGQPDYTYALRILRHPPEGITGPVPRSVAPLVALLGGLMFKYCC
jgi:hypothetical protein